MAVSEKRLQLHISDERLHRIEAVAKLEGCSVAAVMSDASDKHFATQAERRMTAAARLLARPANASQEPDWADVKRALEVEFDSRFTQIVTTDSDYAGVPSLNPIHPAVL
ncbi:MAG: hypothetical protein LBC29_04285 [Propionibacteriaceae bacterium]|jgi:hypothetical protein|nr:hypothetical protein [Propionibacteriaceae bacterium]